MSKVQVLIIGGGPAGCSAAIMCRCFGLTVAIVEAIPFPRAAPGEAHPIGIESYFETLGVNERLMAHNLVSWTANHMEWVKGRPQFLETPLDDKGEHVPARQISRALLDMVLLERARELGVIILQPCVARSLMLKQGRVSGVVTDQGGFAADYVIDAAGSRHWMTRRLNLAIEPHSAPLYGVYGWARGHSPSRFQMPHYIAHDTGWTWTSRVEGDLYQYTRLSWVKETLAADWLPPEFRADGLKGEGRWKGADLTWRRAVYPAGRGFFLAGDALARTDPIVQKGVFKGIVSGMQVAMVLDKIFNEGLSEDQARIDYTQWVQQTYLADLEGIKSYYTRHPSAPDWLHEAAPVPA